MRTPAKKSTINKKRSLSLVGENDLAGMKTSDPIISKKGDRSPAERTIGAPQRANITPYTDKGGDVLNSLDNFKIPDNWKNTYPKVVDDITVGLHWLSLTLFCEKTKAFNFYMDWLYDIFGELQDTGYGLTGFRSMMNSGWGFKLAYEPITFSKMNGNNYVLMILPGAACERLEPLVLIQIYKNITLAGITCRCTRMDYKFDYCNFSPYQFRWMLKNKLVRGYFNRDKIKMVMNNEVDEMGFPGKLNIYTGSVGSERLASCYDTHGFTRLEIRNKGERANSIFQQLMGNDAKDWYRILAGQVQDYICFDHKLWEVFLNDHDRAYMSISAGPDPTLDRLEQAFVNQWAVAFMTLYDIKGRQWFENMANKARERRHEVSKYNLLIHRYGLGKNEG